MLCPFTPELYNKTKSLPVTPEPDREPLKVYDPGVPEGGFSASRVSRDGREFVMFDFNNFQEGREEYVAFEVQEGFGCFLVAVRCFDAGLLEAVRCDLAPTLEKALERANAWLNLWVRGWLSSGGPDVPV